VNKFADWLGWALIGKLLDALVGSAFLGGSAAAGLWGYGWYWLGPSALLFTGYLARGWIKRGIYRLRVANLSGIQRVYPVAPYGGGKVNDTHRDNAENALLEVVRKSRHLRLLLASGFRHIGCEKHAGLFWKALGKRPPGTRVEILLVSDQLSAHRAALAGMDLAVYEEGRRAVLHGIARLAAVHGLIVEVRCYDEEPIWQMVITDSELWLLCAEGTDTARSPVYCIRRNGPYSLSCGLEAVWRRRWAKATPTHLETVAEPDWSKVARSDLLVAADKDG
jgi:hypothetical protein